MIERERERERERDFFFPFTSRISGKRGANRVVYKRFVFYLSCYTFFFIFFPHIMSQANVRQSEWCTWGSASGVREAERVVYDARAILQILPIKLYIFSFFSFFCFFPPISHVIPQANVGQIEWCTMRAKMLHDLLSSFPSLMLGLSFSVAPLLSLSPALSLSCSRSLSLSLALLLLALLPSHSLSRISCTIYSLIFRAWC